ncbi:carbohydrate ABC transporter permease [Kitasatospora sp. NPDC096147]|uniref:carbohydrate ABC transporter permease n=1 Tax=Kitasatospora sp. NPDC096147 TaxID=3364093 RepID=UPI00381D9162
MSTTTTATPAAPGRRRFSPGRATGSVLLGLLAIACAIPMLWLVLAPTKTDAQLVDGHPLSFGSFGGYADAWHNLTTYNDGVVYRWIVNSVLYTGGAVLLSVSTSLLAGYALAATRIAGRRTVLVATLLAMIVPPAALVLPLFLEINAVQLTGTAWSVILPASLYPFGVYLAFIHFSTVLPKEVLEAARIDGCSERQLFSKIALPLARPLIGLLTFFAFVGNWNNYFLPYVMLGEDSTFNLPVGLGALISGTPALNPALGGSFLPIHRPEAAIAGVLTIVPVAVVFLFAQRFLVRGLLEGSVKS